MIVFRHADPRFPFLWETADQPAGRWHGPGEGPVHYLADTPAGAWAEFLRHEEITDPGDLSGVQRALWAIELEDGEVDGLDTPGLDLDILTGGRETYPACRAEARRLRSAGARGLTVTSAALARGAAGGWLVDGGLGPAPPRDGVVLALFGRWPDVVGWAAAGEGRPRADLLPSVRPFGR